MSEISAPPTHGPTPSIASLAGVKAPSSTSDNPSAQHQSAERDDRSPAQSAPAPSPPGHDPAVVLSATMAHLEIGSHVKATVSSPPADGVVELVTANGTFTAPIESRISPGAELTLHIQAVEAKVLASVVAIGETTLQNPLPVELTLTHLASNSAPSEPSAPTLAANYAPHPSAMPDKPSFVTYSPPPPAAGQLPTPIPASPASAAVASSIAGPTSPDPAVTKVARSAATTGIEISAQVIGPAPHAGQNAPPTGQTSQATTSFVLPAGTQLTLSLVTVQPIQNGPGTGATSTSPGTTPSAATPGPPVVGVTAPVVSGNRPVKGVEQIAAQAGLQAAASGQSTPGIASKAGEIAPPIAESGVSAAIPAAAVKTRIPGVTRGEISGVVTEQIEAGPAKGDPSIAVPTPQRAATVANTKTVLIQSNIGTLRAEVPRDISVGDRITARFAASATPKPTALAKDQAPSPASASASTPALAAASALAPASDAAPTPAPLSPPSQMPIEAPVEPHIQPPVTALIEAIPAAVDVLRPEARDLVAAFAGRWQAMDEAIEVLREVAPSTARAVMEAAPSTAAGRLSGPILFFLTAIRAGDARGWLGDKALEVLVQSGRSDLLQRIEEDFARINRVAVETSGNDWRPIILPVHDGQGFNPLFLFLRQHFTGDNRGGDAGQNDEDASGTRFVMDINLKRLGRLQLDGLVAGARFDLIVRSAQPFSTQIRTSILEMFENSNSATGLSGNIVFESGGPIPQTPFASFATDQNKPHTQNMLA